ncbi:MAG: FAD-binding oxidoreductase, partial [Paracoccaceae bacterium]
EPLDVLALERTHAFKGRSLAVVRPASTTEVSAILSLASETKTPVVPQSGNTGLAGGAYAGDGETAILMSLERMNRIRSINTRSRLATVEAGVILANLHEAAEAQGLVFPLMFGARGSCMIGGNLATNAGGSNVVRYGNMRALCAGLEVVMPDGEIVNLMSELLKDNTGYDLRDLFIGAEGTLGVITGAVLRLFPKPSAYATAMIAVPSLSGALGLLNLLQRETGGAVEAFEYMPREYFRHLKSLRPESHLPFAEIPETSILVEIAATSQAEADPDEVGRIPLVARLEALLSGLLEEGKILDATLARNEAQRREMWTQRELAFEVTMSRGIPITADVSVPLDRVGDFLADAGERLATIAPQAEILAIAHLGDGNLHYSLWPNPDSTAAPDAAMKTRVFEAVEDVVARLGGSFSAEHGIGVSKLGSMQRRKDAGALAIMKKIKHALDPEDIMNPGKLLP